MTGFRTTITIPADSNVLPHRLAAGLFGSGYSCSDTTTDPEGNLVDEKLVVRGEAADAETFRLELSRCVPRGLPIGDVEELSFVVTIAEEDLDRSGPNGPGPSSMTFPDELEARRMAEITGGTFSIGPSS